jgi:hypothetical protein
MKDKFVKRFGRDFHLLLLLSFRDVSESVGGGGAVRLDQIGRILWLCSRQVFVTNGAVEHLHSLNVFFS